MTKKSEPSTNNNKTHPWRHCPIGFHYVREHSMRIPPSKKHPKGLVVTRHAHCRKNINGSKDLLSADEIAYISDHYFTNLTGSSTIKPLKDFKKLGDKYDVLILGWTRYWNDVLKYKEPLDPNLVKALIASESSFDANIILPNGARGLMQLLPETFVYLRNPDTKELKDHFVSVNKAQGRDATWIEAVAAYKSYLKNMFNGKEPNPKGMEIFNDLYSQINI